MIDRERLLNFIEEHKIHLVIVMGSCLAILFLVLILGLVINHSQKSQRQHKREESKKVSFSADELWLPDEPFAVPDIQYSRISPPFWTTEDEKTWYNTPNFETLDELDTVARRQIDNLLESVP